MRIAMLSSIAKSTPPRDHISYEQIVSLLTEGMVERGDEVTLFATGDSVTNAKLCAVSPEEYNDDSDIDSGALESLHISHLFEQADEFDLIHNNLGFLPLTYMGMTTTPVVTTIHGFSTPCISDIYKKYSGKRSMFQSVMLTEFLNLTISLQSPPELTLNIFRFSPAGKSIFCFSGVLKKIVERRKPSK